MKSRKKVHLIVERKGGGTLVGTVVELPGVRVEAADITALRKAVRAAIDRHLAERPDAVAVGYAARFVGVEELLLQPLLRGALGVKKTQCSVGDEQRRGPSDGPPDVGGVSRALGIEAPRRRVLRDRTAARAA